MVPLKVLIIDDSVVIRKMLSNCLESEPDIEVVGMASNGSIGLARIDQLNPDIVTLDVEMPVMDGLETLRAIRRTRKNLPVIMFSTLTERGAAITLDALSSGASDYVTKPANMGNVSESLAQIRQQLIPRIRGLCRRDEPPVIRQSARTPERTAIKPKTGTERPPVKTDIIAIGVSTGGPNALASLFSKLRPDLPVPVVVVQHMPELFTRLLADRLNAVSPLLVREGEEGAVLKPGEAWLAPGGRHMEIVKSEHGFSLKLHQGPPENFCRPAVDVLFRSVARMFGSHSIAVILTGMGQDGLRGCELIADAGGYVMAQDQKSSVVWGMPGAVAHAGLARQLLPVDEIAVALNQFTGRGNTAARAGSLIHS
jgi:two-component system chemotaxis response regulator CheB